MSPWENAKTSCLTPLRFFPAEIVLQYWGIAICDNNCNYLSLLSLLQQILKRATLASGSMCHFSKIKA